MLRFLFYGGVFVFIVFSDWLSVLEELFIRVLRFFIVCSGRVWGLKLWLFILEE